MRTRTATVHHHHTLEDRGTTPPGPPESREGFLFFPFDFTSLMNYYHHLWHATITTPLTTTTALSPLWGEFYSILTNHNGDSCPPCRGCFDFISTMTTPYTCPSFCTYFLVFLHNSILLSIYSSPLAWNMNLVYVNKMCFIIYISLENVEIDFGRSGTEIENIDWHM